MITISHQNLDQTNLYTTVLQSVEDVCDEYQLSKEFGIISTACQEVVDYLTENHPSFTTDMEIFIDSTSLSYNFYCAEPLFGDLLSHYADENILKDLSDKIEVSSDNKQVSLTFHVKTHIPIATPQSAMQTQYQEMVHRNF